MDPSSGVDHVFDFPPELAGAITGFRYDEDRELELLGP